MNFSAFMTMPRKVLAARNSSGENKINQVFLVSLVSTKT